MICNEIKKLVQASNPPRARLQALDELQSRLLSRKGLDLDAFAISAHNVDKFIKVDQIKPDHECEVEIDTRLYGGGSGANTMAVLGMLGLSVGVSGIVSGDEDGAFLRKDLQAMNVRIDNLRTYTESESHTGRTMILFDNEARRTILVEPGVNMNYPGYINDEYELDSLVEQCGRSRIVHLSSFSSEDAINAQAKLVSKLDDAILVSFTPGQLYCRYGLAALEPILKRTNLVFLYKQQLEALIHALSDYEANSSIRDKIKLIFKWKQRKKLDEPLIVVVKNREHKECKNERYVNIGVGRDDLEGFFQSNPISELPERLKDKDTTGAGDSLAGGILYGLLANEDLTRCANYGLIAALNASESEGARTDLLDKEEWSRRLNEYFRYS